MRYININNVSVLLDFRQYQMTIVQILQIQNYRESLKKWIINFKTKYNHEINRINTIKYEPSVPKDDNKQLQKTYQQQLQLSFDKYFKTIKPVSQNFTSLTSSLHHNQYGFYSEILNKQHIVLLKQMFQPLQRFQILIKQEMNPNSSIVHKQQLQALIYKKQPIYRMDLSSPPQNNEIKYWYKTIPIQKFIIQGQVIKGKGIGKQGLGMPTANIKLPANLDQSLKQYPNGIYITLLTIKNKPQVYIGASSLGTNPHYQNSTSNRILQTYILNDFQDQYFYGETLITQFHQLIRLQFKFSDFSSFLHGMRNDIQVAQKWVDKLKYKKQLFCS